MPICSAEPSGAFIYICLYIYIKLLKYGYSNFQLEILEYSTKNKVLIKEQYYLDLLKSEYNILTTALALL